MALERKSLLDTLSPLVNDCRTGMLEIFGRFGFKAKLYLRAGCVFHAECGRRGGSRAIRSIAKRKAVMICFIPDREPEEVARTRFSTGDVLYFFRQADQVWGILQKAVDSYDDVFVVAQIVRDLETVSKTHRKVLLALDGCRTVKQVIQETGVAEMDVLYAIFLYSQRGKVERREPKTEEARNICRRFLGKLKDELHRSIPPPMSPIKNSVAS